MTSVPKPLKFLRVHYDTLKEIYEKIKDKETQVYMCLKVICDNVECVMSNFIVSQIMLVETKVFHDIK